ncbi:hypothetical protein QNO07_05625 [Streptomyces sp. 549]|uniref:hypothetical protein n=1 Tax=Streptomyces sp. 549 TaxID=3049076 RepID=UPI0024C43981|nr:hypothetical protein [Streptomyces sp. 549]MDK1472915.1 hypothetical protein [Streptomyces sp. 549]
MNTFRKQATVLVVGAATLGSLLVPASMAAAAPAKQNTAVTQPGEVRAAGIKIDVVTSTVDISNRLYNIISQAIAHKQNRSGYVKSLREGAFYDARERYNVMIIKADHKYSSNLKRIVYDAKVKGGNYPTFRVIVFESGSFTNRGDGGYDNWAFRGWYKRDGMTVNFRKK